ncbi:MAG TPA: ATP-binding protein, partial [Usitatibacter sp.]
MKKPHYDAQDIQVLEGLEPVRERPGMYIGSTGPRGLHHLVYEVVDNSVDEALAGYCDGLVVTINPDNSVTIVDNGRGIPVGIMDKYNKPAAEIVLTMLHAGGKFGGAGYKVSGGLHGVGVSVVNALSEWLELDIYVEGFHWHERFERGAPIGTLERKEKLGKDAPSGTTVSFMADPDIFEEVVYDYRVLAQRLRETAFLTRSLRIELNDERAEGERVVFKYDGGIRDFVAYINRDKDAIHRSIIFLENETKDGAVEIAMQWNSSYNESIFTFANNINTTEGGTHLSGFRSALTRTVNDYARQKGLLKEKEDNLSGEDVREGLTAVVSVKLRDPQFEGQTKTKLGNTEAKTFVQKVVGERLGDWFDSHP